MGDYRALVVDYFDEEKDRWFGFLIRTYDPETVKSMLGIITGLEVDGESQLITRYIETHRGSGGPIYLCEECEWFDEQQNFIIQEDGESCVCPRCGNKQWIECMGEYEV